MFFEAMEDILPELKVIIDNGDGTTQAVILDGLLGAGAKSQSSPNSQAARLRM